MKTLLTIATILLTLSLSAQNRYYLIAPVDSVAPALVISAQTVGNPEARYNLNADTAIVKMDLALAPAWAGIAYTREQARAIVEQPSWTASNPAPIESETRVALARVKGIEFYDVWVARIDRNVYGTSTWTVNQGANAFSNFSTMWEIVLAGEFEMASDLIGSGVITSAGVITQPMLDSFKAKLDRWIADHPRP